METNRGGAEGQHQAAPEGIPAATPDRQAEMNEIEEAEAYERYLAAWNNPVLTEQRAADAEAEAESEAIWQENRIGLRGAHQPEAEAEL